MSVRKITVVVAIILVGALLVFSAAMLPALVKDRVCAAIQQATGRVTSVDSMSINPLTLSVSAKNLVIREAGGGAFITCPALRAAISPSSLSRRTLILSEVTLESPSVTIARAASGRYNFSDIIEHGQTHRQPAPREPFPLTINDISVANGSVLFSDAVPKGDFRSSLNGIDATVKHFTTAAHTSAEYTVSLRMDNEASLTTKGSFSLFPAAAQATTELKGLNLHKGWPYLARFLTAPVKGTLDLSGDIAYGSGTGLRVENGRMTIHQLSTRYGTDEEMEVSSLAMTGATFEQQANRLDIAEIRLSQGKAAVSREADGRISILSLLTAQKNSKPETKGTGLPIASKKLTYRLKQLRVDRFNLLFTDKTRLEKPAFTLKDTDILLTNLSGPDFTPAQLVFSTTFGTRATLKGSGDITPHPLHYKGDLTVHHLPIKDFAGYFPDNLNVKIVNGFLDTAVKVDITLKNGRPVGTFRGSTGVRSFRSIDTVAGEDLLTWESLQLDKFHGSLEPFILDAREIALNGVYSRIVVRKDGTLNLQHLVRKPEGPIPSRTKGAVPLPVATAKSQVTIGAVTIQDGTLSFSDTHLPQLFSTTFHKLGGRISGLSSEASTRADVDLRGNLESQSPLQITGKINPLRNDLYVDMKVSFHDIELSPASPYSGSYLGYSIEKGKLFLDLKYHIENRLLTSENKIFIDQFTFGDKVESDKATSLPVQLGLALLKDSRGEIHLDVPVSGRIDNPELSIWKLVGQAFTNLLVKAATSPLALLSSLFGGDDDFSAIPFAHGASGMNTGERVKLDNLAKALLDRPALKLELTGYVDREKDVEGYRLELFGRKLTNEKIAALGREGALKTGENIETIQVLPEEYTTILAAVYRKEKFPKPRNALGLVKNLPDEEMKKLIIVNIIIGEHELRTLARERVSTIMNYLVHTGGIPAERLFQNDDDIFKAPDKGSMSRSRVEVAAIVQ